jgi:hypothetical protein
MILMAKYTECPDEYKKIYDNITRNRRNILEDHFIEISSIYPNIIYYYDNDTEKIPLFYKLFEVNISTHLFNKYILPLLTYDDLLYCPFSLGIQRSPLIVCYCYEHNYHLVFPRISDTIPLNQLNKLFNYYHGSKTLLHTACMVHNYELVELLLNKYGIDTQIKDNHNNLPSYYASKKIKALIAEYDSLSLIKGATIS